MLMLPLLAACTWSCSDSLIDEASLLPAAGGDEKLIKEVVIRMPELKNTADTRTLFNYDEVDGISTKWAYNDVIGVVPVDVSANKANQVKFPLSEGVWSTVAKFDGGAWSLKNDLRYGAYFPFSAENYEKNPSEFTLNYEGQVQEWREVWQVQGLSQYDYMAAPAGVADENGSITFEMQRLGGVVGFHFPEGIFYDAGYLSETDPARLVLSSDDEIFGVVQTLDLTGDNPVMEATVNKRSISMDLREFYFYENNDNADLDSYAYMMLPPMSATDITLTVVMADSTEYCATINNFNVVAGQFKGYEIGSVVNKSAQAIQFEDENTKNAVLEALHLTGDITYRQASKVTHLAFENSSNYAAMMEKFNEFQYFTGLTEVEEELFWNRRNLREITLPESITAIGSKAFSGCTNLTQIELPFGVTEISWDAFRDCTSLSQIILPDGLTRIDSYAFDGCSSLTSITLPSHLESIGASAFRNAGFTEVTIPASVTDIATNAFYSRDQAMVLTFLGMTPPRLSESFLNPEQGGQIFVPYDAYYTYYYHEDFRRYGLQPYIDAYIEFVDPEVKSICESNFDKDSNGRISIKDLANVQNADVFGKFWQTDIEQFYEFRFFTGLNWDSDDWNQNSNKMLFAFCNNLAYIELPEECSKIFDGMFSFSSTLHRINIPYGVQSIGSDAFFGCNSLTDVYMWCTEVPTLEDQYVFYMQENSDRTGINPALKIHVRIAMLNDFKAAPNWSHYASYIVGD